MTRKDFVARIDIDPEYRAQFEDRFWSRVDRRSPSDCWLWRGRLNQNGYGAHYLLGSRANEFAGMSASRVATWLVHGRPAVLGRWQHSRHLCHNKPCCNPAHLVWGTPLQNVMDSRRAGRDPTVRHKHRKWDARYIVKSVREAWSVFSTVTIPCRTIPVAYLRDGGGQEIAARRAADHEERIRLYESRMDAVHPFDHGKGQRMGSWSLFDGTPFVPDGAPPAPRYRHLKMGGLKGSIWMERRTLLPWMRGVFRDHVGRYWLSPHPWLMDAARRMMEVNDAA